MPELSEVDVTTTDSTVSAPLLVSWTWLPVGLVEDRDGESTWGDSE